MKTGIYGGTFSPIHNGHLHVAQKAMEQFSLDRIIFLPSGNSYMKSNVLSGEHRYRMVCLAVRDTAGYEVSDMEIRREGATYSYESMEMFRDRYPQDELYFILGEDSFRIIEQWREPERLLSRCSLIVAARTEAGAHDMELSDYAKCMEEKYQTHIYCMDTREMISSSMIRRMASSGKDISGYVPESVEKYIVEHHLYV